MDAVRQTFRDVDEEARYFRHTQLTKYTHLYSITLQLEGAQALATPKFLEPILQVMEDADFHITHVCGSVTDPVDVNGQRVVDSGSSLELFFPMAGSANRGDRGISFKFLDPKENTRHTEARITQNAVDLAAQTANVNFTYLNFADVFAPGYDYGFSKLVPFNYYLARGERLKILLQSRDGRANSLLYSRVSMGFVGNRYDNA